MYIVTAGPGDPVTWPACAGHPNDPRTDDSAHDAALDAVCSDAHEVEAAITAALFDAHTEAQILGFLRDLFMGCIEGDAGMALAAILEPHITARACGS